MKRTALKLTLISALLFLVLAGTQIANLAEANPSLGKPVPPAYQTPNKDPPIVAIQSPFNTTYFENEVSLNFTVTQPDSWLKPDIHCYITNISYQLDGGQVVTLYKQTPSVYYLPATKQFSIVLKGVTVGQHILQVNVTAESQYYPHPTYSLLFDQAYHPLDVSQTIAFNVEPSPTTIGIATISPAAIIGIGLLVSIIGIGLLVYFKKRKR